ncbi:unnamed protein product [Fusarium langsethiae]|nr:unnamed protein product [Fusarium langsethiae]
MNCPAFKLSLNYNALGSRDIGFVQGWEFNLSRYNHRQGRTLSLVTGEQYQIYDSPDSVTVKDQKLKSFHFRKEGSQYHVTYKSGQREILSNSNNIYNMSVPVEIIAPNGRSLKFSWTPVGSVPRLDTISDGRQDLVAIKYGSGMAEVICSPGTPESATFVFMQLNKNLSKLTLPGDGGSWDFKYQTMNDYSLLTQVTSPAGLLEVMTYDAEGHLLPVGAPTRAMPCILSHTIYPGKIQLPTKTLYKFSSHNFLGYGGVSQWSDGEDNLYRSPANYNYTSTVRVEGGTTTIYKYNKYHLLLSTQSQHDTKRVTEETIYHCIEGSTFKDQPAQYQMPKTKKITYEDLATAGALRSETTSYSFDVWGNATEVVEPNGIKTTRDYFPAEGRSSRSKQFKYTQLPCVKSPSASATANDPCYFVAVKEQLSLVDGEHLTSRKYLYVNQIDSADHGRIREHVESLNGQYSNTQTLQYEHIDAGRLKTTVKTTSFDGITVQTEKICTKSTGATVSQTDEHGFRTNVKHDLMGRVVETTVNVGTLYEATEKQEFVFCSDGQGYELTQTDAQGYKTRITTDAMKRVTQVSKQGDYDKETLRVVEELKYNDLGQCIQVDNIDWIESTNREIRTSKKIPCSIHLPDDRAALLFALQLAHNPHVSIHVVHLHLSEDDHEALNASPDSDPSTGNDLGKNAVGFPSASDMDLLNTAKNNAAGKLEGRVTFVEISVNSVRNLPDLAVAHARELVGKSRFSVGDLIIAGRSHTLFDNLLVEDFGVERDFQRTIGVLGDRFARAGVDAGLLVIDDKQAKA